MNKKYFVIDEKKNTLSKKKIESIESGNAKVLKGGYDKNRELTKKRLSEEKINLKHTEGRIIIKIDIDGKNLHTFESGVTIYRGRQFNDLNRRQTEPVNAFVIDSEYILKGSEILIHPNSICDANKIFNYAVIGIEENNSLRYYSIEENSAFLFREGEVWKPLKNYATALRVFKPYSGLIAGIEPEQIKNVLYLTSGELKGLVCHTVKAADYCIIFQDINGREGNVIKCRHYENGHDRQELVAIDYGLTDKVNKAELLVGINISDAKALIK